MTEPRPTAAASESASKNSNLRQRVLTVAVLLPILLGLLQQGGWAWTLMASAAVLACVQELHGMSLPGQRLATLPATIGAVAMPIVMHLGPVGERLLPACWVFIILGSLLVRVALPGPLESAAPQIATATFNGLYASLLSYTATCRDLSPLPGWAGTGWTLLVLGATWGGDTGAYFGGRLLGRHPFSPRISPKKTWEGFFAGMATSVVVVFVVRATLLPQLGIGHTLVLALLGGVGGPLGDLAESLLKRAYKVKDSGHLIPGHGGIMDRVDALLVTGPLMYFYVTLMGLAAR